MDQIQAQRKTLSPLRRWHAPARPEFLSHRLLRECATQHHGTKPGRCLYLDIAGQPPTGRAALRVSDQACCAGIGLWPTLQRQHPKQEHNRRHPVGPRTGRKYEQPHSPDSPRHDAAANRQGSVSPSETQSPYAKHRVVSAQSAPLAFPRRGSLHRATKAFVGLSRPVEPS